MNLPEVFAFLSLSSRDWGATIPGAPGVLPGLGGSCSSLGMFLEGWKSQSAEGKVPKAQPYHWNLLL